MALYEVTDDNFDTEVLQSQQPVLVDFWAAWCGPCRMIAPVVESIAEEYAGQFKVAKLDVDRNPNVTNRYGVLSIPTLILFKDGEVVERVIGYKPRHERLEKIRQYLD